MVPQTSDIVTAIQPQRVADLLCSFVGCLPYNPRDVPLPSSELANSHIATVLPTQYLTKEDMQREQASLRQQGDTRPLLPPQAPQDLGKKTLVLDLDETLVHCSFEPLPGAECLLPVVLDGVTYTVYACVRPGATELLRRLGQVYEIVVYTASLRSYAEIMVRHLDQDGVVRHVLSRDACFAPRARASPFAPLLGSSSGGGGGVLKDVALLRRALSNVVLVDNSPASAAPQPLNAVIVASYLGRADDELLRLVPFLESLSAAPDVRAYAKAWPAYRKRARALDSRKRRLSPAAAAGSSGGGGSSSGLILTSAASLQRAWSLLQGSPRGSGAPSADVANPSPSSGAQPEQMAPCSTPPICATGGA
eukprot:TRINITY_DN2352_c0_g1_i3.p1 TRINITY_DN2352_c0_g1~~TRINITY_DN2352_c0_g1_i3.p1  ORF type:complete len:364 (-),score=136.55 TRINITY_DN2352_c0_g1_i3:102-1193(-)